MRSFKHHISATSHLDEIRIPLPKSLVSRLQEGISKFDIELDELFVETPPKNSSKQSLYELQELEKLAKSGFCSELIEMPIIGIVESIMDSNEIHLAEPSRRKLVGVLHDVRTACLELQYRYGRIRPRKLAEVVGIKLPTTYSHQDSTPSYPSTRSTQMEFISLYMGERFEKLEKTLSNTAEEVNSALMRSALNYRSDIEASKELARYLFNSLKRKM